MKIFKSLYGWVLRWASTPYGSIALFILAFIESIFFPIPSDVLFIALALGHIRKSFQYAFICVAGSVSGAVIGFYTGNLAWLKPDGDFTNFAYLFFNNIPGFTIELYDKIRLLYDQFDFWVIFVAGFTPVPYKLFTITAGVFDMNLLNFFIASLVSRGARFFLLAFLIWKFGPSIKYFIQKYFNLIAIGISICLIGVFFLIKYFI